MLNLSNKYEALYLIESADSRKSCYGDNGSLYYVVS